jgi:hypothetical protein
MNMKIDTSSIEHNFHDDYSNPNTHTLSELIRGVKLSMPELFTHTFEDMTEELAREQDIFRTYNPH